MNDQEYSILSRKVRVLTGLDLESYKSQQMQRRLNGYVASQAEDVASFCRVLERDPVARDKLLNFLTINVSEFFRDEDQFNRLQTIILPELAKGSGRLNIWSAGCSHGGEPYSIAIFLEELPLHPDYRILATDLDPRILARAKAGGPYSPADVRGVPKDLLARYFLPLKEGFEVQPSLRRRVEFRRHNLLADPFEKGFDLIACRNVTIYFADDAKLKLMRGFHEALRLHGMLFIGATESLLDAPDLGFERVTGSFYRKAALRSTVSARPPALVKP